MLVIIVPAWLQISQQPFMNIVEYLASSVLAMEINIYPAEVSTEHWSYLLLTTSSEAGRIMSLMPITLMVLLLIIMI